MSLLRKVQLILNTLHKGIEQIPEYKRPENINKIQALIKKCNV